MWPDTAGWPLPTMERARGFFERALALDPGNIEALVGTALVHYRIVNAFMTDDPAPHIAAAETALTKVLSVAPNHAWAHAAFGSTLIHSNRAARGIGEIEQALALDPNLAWGHAMIGLAKYFVGRGSETETHIRESIRLSPRDTYAYSWMANAGVAKLALGSDEEAVTWLRRGVEANPNHSTAPFWLAAALAHLDRLDEASLAVQTGLSLNPTFTISRYRKGAFSNIPAYLTQRGAGLRGYAEGRTARGMSAFKLPVRPAAPWPLSDQGCRSLR
jgi:tetratricopeptide (TPR) repeat protein